LACQQKSEKFLFFLKPAFILCTHLAVLWISQPFGLGRIYPHAGAPCGLRERGSQWITMLRICGLRGFATVDYASLWISQHSVLGRICPLAGSLWITGLRHCRLRMQAHAVD
jgi:hypothetical protein